MIDVSTPGTPGWWLAKLESALVYRRTGPNWNRIGMKVDERPPLELLDSYLRGEPPLPMAALGWPDVMREALRIGRLNLAELSVDTVVNKMNPLGFRTSADSDYDGDQEAARICSANRFDTICTDVFSWMLGLGDGYMQVGPGLDDPKTPTITAAHPFSTITSDDPITGRPRAGLRMIRDDDYNVDRAYLYLPGFIRVAVRGRMATNWEWDDENSIVLPSNMKDVVPLRRFKNRRGIGEFEPHLNTLDRINKRIFQSLVGTEYQVFAMRVFAGLPPVDKDGELIDYSNVFTNDPGSVVVLDKDEDGTQVQLLETRQTNFDPIRMFIRDDMQSFAAATSTPLHLITPDAAAGSAEGATLQREGGLDKVGERRKRAGHPLAEVMALAFRFAGDDTRTDVTKIKTIWGPAQQFSPAQATAAAVAARSIGVPYDTVAQDYLQYSPEDIAHQRTLMADDALNQPITPQERSAVSGSAGLTPTFQEPTNGQQA